MVVSDAAGLIARQTALCVAPQCVHVWGFSLSAEPHCVARCWEYLAPDERARAVRFIHPADRDEFIVAHGVLRAVLARYAGATPPGLRFAQGPAGKPFLIDSAGSGPSLSFNLSHSRSRALLAVSDGRELGVDLEKLRSDLDVRAIAGRWFFGLERTAIETAPDVDRVERFFRYWVAKEAVLKAEGVGLGFPLDRFEVIPSVDGTAASVRTEVPERLAADWEVRLLPVEPGWAAAIAAKAGAWGVRVEPGVGG